jgi:hypothetical protein
MTELVSIKPAPQFRNEFSWVRGSELIRGSSGSCVSFWLSDVFVYPVTYLNLSQVYDQRKGGFIYGALRECLAQISRLKPFFLIHCGTHLSTSPSAQYLNPDWRLNLSEVILCKKTSFLHARSYAQKSPPPPKVEPTRLVELMDSKLSKRLCWDSIIKQYCPSPGHCVHKQPVCSHF